MGGSDQQEGNGAVDLGQLDITSDNVSLAGLADQLDALAEGSLIDSVLDGGWNRFIFFNSASIK